MALSTKAAVNLPPPVAALKDAVSAKLGREAHVRKVNNGDSYYVNDPVFSHVQKGARGISSGYRVGFELNIVGGYISFEIVHSPIMFRFFRENATDDLLYDVFRKTIEYREFHCASWSSKSVIAAKTGGVRKIRNDSESEFKAELPNPWVVDIAARRPKQVGVGSRTTVRSYFSLLLGHWQDSANIERDLREIVNKSWELFLCLYPGRPILARNASLARSMKAQDIPQICEFKKIEFPKGCEIASACQGRIEGAHIDPYIRGGGDRATNGLWLCCHHHRGTEGRLSGYRTKSEILVKFT